MALLGIEGPVLMRVQRQLSDSQHSTISFDYRQLICVGAHTVFVMKYSLLPETSSSLNPLLSHPLCPLHQRLYLPLCTVSALDLSGDDYAP